jgi:hypothetical protein
MLVGVAASAGKALKLGAEFAGAAAAGVAFGGMTPAAGAVAAANVVGVRPANGSVAAGFPPRASRAFSKSRRAFFGVRRWKSPYATFNPARPISNGGFEVAFVQGAEREQVVDTGLESGPTSPQRVAHGAECSGDGEARQERKCEGGEI